MKMEVRGQILSRSQVKKDNTGFLLTVTILPHVNSPLSSEIPARTLWVRLVLLQSTAEWARKTFPRRESRALASSGRSGGAPEGGMWCCSSPSCAHNTLTFTRTPTLHSPKRSFTALWNNFYGSAFYQAVISERNTASLAVTLYCLRICWCLGKKEHKNNRYYEFLIFPLLNSGYLGGEKKKVLSYMSYIQACEHQCILMDMFFSYIQPLSFSTSERDLQKYHIICIAL